MTEKDDDEFETESPSLTNSVKDTACTNDKIADYTFGIYKDKITTRVASGGRGTEWQTKMRKV